MCAEQKNCLVISRLLLSEAAGVSRTRRKANVNGRVRKQAYKPTRTVRLTLLIVDESGTFIVDGVTVAADACICPIVLSEAQRPFAP